MEVAGTVIAVGAGVVSLAPGASVVAFTPDGGGFAEFVAADAGLAAIVPDTVDLAAATAIPLIWATALGLTRRAQGGPADRVLVTSAAGGVGTALAGVLDTIGDGTTVGAVGSADKQTHVASRYLPIVRDRNFYPHALKRPAERST
jgi:NADPH2:quinone reductase